jgi:hypothetical protein
MKSDISNREMVRQYLLGRLDDNEEIEVKVSDDVFFKSDLSEIVDEVEDEIIEEYEEGILNSADRKAVEEYFLRSPARRERLRFYKLLRQHLATKQLSGEPQPAVHPVKNSDASRRGLAERLRIGWGTRVLVYAQAAALLAFAVLGWVYVSGVRKERALLQGELVQEKMQAASQVTLPTQLQPPIVVLTLVSDRSRATGTQVPRAEITTVTKRIIVEVALTGKQTGSYDVRLETREGHGANWTAKLLPLMSPEGDPRLVFDLPAQHLQPGFYSLVISSDGSTTGKRNYYDFEVQFAE